MGSSPPALTERPSLPSRPRWRSGAAGAALTALIGLLGCGGAQGGGSAAPESTSETSTEDDATPSESAETAPPRDPCADGSCFTCGDGLCPPGFYCDEGAADGPTCSWAPACPRDPSCACVERELGAGCRCEQRGGGLYVSCS